MKVAINTKINNIGEIACKVQVKHLIISKRKHIVYTTLLHLPSLGWHGNFHVSPAKRDSRRDVAFPERNAARTMTLRLIVGDCINIDECLDGCGRLWTCFLEIRSMTWKTFTTTKAPIENWKSHRVNIIK